MMSGGSSSAAPNGNSHFTPCRNNHRPLLEKHPQHVAGCKHFSTGGKHVEYDAVAQQPRCFNTDSVVSSDRHGLLREHLWVSTHTAIIPWDAPHLRRHAGEAARQR